MGDHRKEHIYFAAQHLKHFIWQEILLYVKGKGHVSNKEGKKQPGKWMHLSYQDKWPQFRQLDSPSRTFSLKWGCKYIKTAQNSYSVAAEMSSVAQHLTEVFLGHRTRYSVLFASCLLSSPGSLAFLLVLWATQNPSRIPIFGLS